MGEIIFLRLDCSGCDVQLRIRLENAGRKVRCPSCESLTSSPTVDQLEHLRSLDDLPAPMMTEANDDQIAEMATA